MTGQEKLSKLQELLSACERDFLSLRPPRGQKASDPLKLDNIAAEIRRLRLEIDVLLGLPPVGRPKLLSRFKPKLTGYPRPGQEPRGRAPDWRKGK